MAAHLDPHSRSLGDASDMELVECTREGNSAAFGELWVRHSRAGRAVARSHRFDADDLLSEAFARVFQAISAGGGPTAAFRPYLFTTIRNVSMQWARAKNADASEDLDLIADPSTEEDASLAALDKSLTVSAFRSLPTRWQETLWYSEVEQLTSAEIAPLLGMKANAVSALAYRAREGLRQAWIQAHLQRTTDPECAVAIERLGSFTRGTLGPRESKRVREHLSGCTSCSIVADEARQVGSRLALVLLPLAAGVSGAAGFLSWTQAGSGAAGGMAAAAALPRNVVGGSSSAVAPNSGTSSSSSSSGGGTALGAAVVVGGVVGALALAATVVAAVTLGPGLWNAPASTTANSSDVSSDDDSVTVAAPPAVKPQPSTAPAPAPTTEPTSPPEQPQPPATPTKPTPPTEPAEPEKTPVPTSPPVDPQDPLAPTVTSFVQNDDLLTFPQYSGTAEPGATVDIVDSANNVLASTVAGTTGSWTINDFGSSITGAPEGRDAYVRQTTTNGAVSDSAMTHHLTVRNGPSIDDPAPNGQGIPLGQPYDLTVTGADGKSFQRLRDIDGEIVVRPDIHVLGEIGNPAGSWTGSFTADQSGETRVGMRYFDPNTSRFGITTWITYNVL
ncbi:RNA polymerase sigma factor, sigma-70 family [Agreia bicolorata]|uniref:RNA polymerase sigma factor, sigma-70 family n=1 Tax=Agreia bicolorata TaxID=110935 RepID=A0A1T4XQ33_9MICO|nr:sigma-70 family RNA polymerase sigma factor [Agreia bicolorata]SKA91650.1 RNA polymerase sigma factor, sigma-70 family [Agreia bicolorata]